MFALCCLLAAAVQLLQAYSVDRVGSRRIAWDRVGSRGIAWIAWDRVGSRGIAWGVVWIAWDRVGSRGIAYTDRVRSRELQIRPNPWSPELWHNSGLRPGVQKPGFVLASSSQLRTPSSSPEL